jgi:hypothetical protein
MASSRKRAFIVDLPPAKLLMRPASLEEFPLPGFLDQRIEAETAVLIF